VAVTPKHHGLGHINGHDNGNGLKLGHVKGHGGHAGVLVPVPEAEFVDATDESPDEDPARGRGLKLGHAKWHAPEVDLLVPVPEAEFDDVAAGPPGNGRSNRND
jgi:hypothetical protein